MQWLRTFTCFGLVVVSAQFCAAASMPMAPLARARALDLVGDEQGCMSAINEAKSQIGAQ